MTAKNAEPRVLVLGNGSVAAKVRDAGGDVVSMQYHDEAAIVATASSDIDALVLCGGSDVSPELYGQRRHRETYGLDTLRDMVEQESLLAAFDRGLPVLGICRGSQMLNVAAGGTLEQHIYDDRNVSEHWGSRHPVTAKRGTILADAFAVKSPRVVSYHHQSVAKVAPGFRISATSHDGVPEAIERESGAWQLGVQFHPEMDSSESSRGVFAALVKAAAEFGGVPVPRRRSAQLKAQPRRRSAQPKAQPWYVRREVADSIVSHPAPTPRRRALTLNGSRVATSWVCFRCGDLRFDERADHLDHMFVVHGVRMVADQRGGKR